MKKLLSILIVIIAFETNALTQNIKMPFMDAMFEKALRNYKEGVASYEKGNYDKAIQYFRESIKARNSTNRRGTAMVAQEITTMPDTIISATYNMDGGMLVTNKIDPSKSDRLSHLEIRRNELKDMSRITHYPTDNAEDWIAYCYFLKGSINDANKISINYRLKPLDHLADSIYQAESYYNLGERRYGDIGKWSIEDTYDYLIEPYNECLDLFRKQLDSNHWKFSYIYYSMGKVAYKKNNLNQAKDFLRKAVDIIKSHDNNHPLIQQIEELNIKIEKTLSQYSKAEMQYERGIANYYKGNYDESLECFRECWAENNLILEVRPSDTPYITSNAPLWIAHILYMQGKKEKLAVHLRRCRQIYNQYEYIIRPDNQFNSIDVETELFSTDIRRLSNNHRDSRAIDKFYSKILDNYNHNNKNKGSLYAHILLGWADNCGLANNKKKEKELLQQAEQFCNSNSNTKWNFPTVIEQFIRNDSIAYAEGHTIIGRYLGQTGYKTKEPDKKETPVSERAPLNRKKGQKLDLSKEKPIYKGEFQVRHTNGDSFKFSEPFSGRYLCIEITSNHSGQEYACIHKIGLYDYLGKSINNKDFKIIYADSEDNISGDFTANNIISNRYGKWWCTAKGAKLPHYVVIDLGKEYKLSRIDVKKLQRKECFIGDIKEFNLYLKSTPFNF